MNLIRNLFSSLISFFLIPLLIIFIIANSFSGVFLKPENFKGVLKSNDTYNRLASDVIPTFLINIAARGNSETAIPPKSLESIVAKVDKKVLAADLEKMVNSIYDFVTTDAKHFETKIDLTQYTTPLIANLKQSVTDYYNSLPVCTPEAEAAIDQNSLGSLNCKPKGLGTTKYLESLKIDSLIEDVKTSLPTQLIINDQQITTFPQTNLLEGQTPNKGQDNTKASTFLNLQKSVQSYQTGMKFLLITILILFTLLALTRLPNLASSCKWVSSALFSSSILPLGGATLMLYFLKPDFFKNILNGLLDNKFGADFQTAAVSLLADGLFSFSEKVFQQMQLLAFILVVISVILYGVYFFLDRQSKQKAKKPLDAVLNTTHNISK